MANVTITQLPTAGTLAGTESVPIVQNGVTVQTTTGAIAGTAVQNQTFITVNQEVSLPNSRALTQGNGISITAGAPQGNITVALANSFAVSGSITASNIDGIIGATTPAAGSFTNITGSANAVISVTDNTNAALRITQLGTGNALLVEDEANPDSTPFVIDALGNVGIGGLPNTATTSLTAWTDTSAWTNITIGKSNNGDNSPNFNLIKSRGTRSAPVIVNSNDNSGSILFTGYDGSTYVAMATIRGYVDGTPGTNDMPGRLVFSTTADGASSPTERMRIDSAGSVGIGEAPPAGVTLYIPKPQTGAVSAFTISARMNPAADVTNFSYGCITFAINGVGTSTTTFIHYTANQGTFSGTAPTNQYGFNATSALTGATNNYGFYGNIAAGTNRYNIYAQGTADNYFAGSVGIGAVPTAAAKSNITSTSAGASTIALSLQNASTTINSETVLDLVATTAGAGVRSAQITAINTDGSTGVNMLFKISNGTPAVEAMRLDSLGNFIVSTGAVVVYQPGPAGISAAATLTNANIQSQIISTTGTTYTVTMPLGTTLETLITWAAVNLGYNFTVINTASGTITMAVNTGVTSLGSLTIATATSAQFRIRRTAANTFILYRLA